MVHTDLLLTLKGCVGFPLKEDEVKENKKWQLRGKSHLFFYLHKVLMCFNQFISSPYIYILGFN